MATLSDYIYSTNPADGDILAAGYLDALQNALVPVGGIIAWLKSMTGTPSLPDHFAECNGQTLSDVQSPYNGAVIPNLNASGGGTKRFLRGSTTSGTTGGSDTTSAWSAVSGTFFQTGTSVNQYYNNTVALLPSYYEVVWVMRIK